MASFLGGAMRALARNDKTRRFFDTKRYADLPGDWASDPEIVDMAHKAYLESGLESPFFKAYFGNSKITGPYGDPLPIYTGSRVAGLRVIDPAMSQYAQRRGVPGAAFGSSEPGVAYTYQLHPGPDLADPVYQDVMGSAARVLDGGGSLLVPGLDRPFTGRDGGVKSLSDVLNYVDFRMNLDQLESLPRPRTGHHISAEALNDLSTYRPAHDLFVLDNASKLGLGDAEGFSIFSRPLGQVHPLYVHAERPVIAESRPGVRNWTQLADMRVDASSLSPDELETLRRSGGSSVADAFPDSIWTPYAGKRVVQPTDEFAGYLARNTDHDALLMRNVVDGADGLVSMSDVAAWFKPWQAKSAYNWGTFNPWDPSIYRAAGPVAVGGGALAAAMGAPASAEARLRERDLPVEEAWNPLEALALAPVGAASLAGAAGSFLADAAMGLAPDIPDIPEEYYEAAQ